MKKSDKKLEKQLVDALTRVCDQALVSVSGFQWLTHFVNFKNYPQSLTVLCVFDNQSDIENAHSAESISQLYRLISAELNAVDVTLSPITEHVRFDSEEACEFEHGGKWNLRLRQH